MYSIEFAHTAAKEFEKIYRCDKSLYGRLYNAIQSLAKDPGVGKRLSGRLKGDCSLRVGSYRIIYTVYHQKLIVYIIDVGHRKEIYREK